MGCTSSADDKPAVIKGKQENIKATAAPVKKAVEEQKQEVKLDDFPSNPEIGAYLKTVPLLGMNNISF